MRDVPSHGRLPRPRPSRRPRPCSDAWRRVQPHAGEPSSLLPSIPRDRRPECPNRHLRRAVPTCRKHAESLCGPPHPAAVRIRDVRVCRGAQESRSIRSGRLVAPNTTTSRSGSTPSSSVSNAATTRSDTPGVGTLTTTRGGKGVDFVEEDQRRRRIACALEQLSYGLFGGADPLVHQLCAFHGMNAEVPRAGKGTNEIRLAAARRP